MGIEIFKKHLREKRAIKIFCGSKNNDSESVKQICTASQNAKASAVCVSYSKENIQIAKKYTKLPIFASSSHPFELLQAVQNGADAIEISNFDLLYKNGFSYSKDEVYNIVLETLSLISKYNIYTCATIPSFLDTHEQIELAKQYAILGINLIQLENYDCISKDKSSNALFVENFQIALDSTSNLYKNIALPIITNCNFNSENSKKLFLAGANGINVDTSVFNYSSQIELCARIMTLVQKISYRNSIKKETLYVANNPSAF